MKNSRSVVRGSWLMAFAALACVFTASARTVTTDEATYAARAWVHRGKTLGAKFPSDVALDAVSHTTTNGAVFYTVKMANGGTVFTSGDTTVAPVLGFTSDTSDYSTIDEKSPLWALLNGDVSDRQPVRKARLALATVAAATQQATQSANEEKWAALVEEGGSLSTRRVRLLSAVSVASSGTSEPGDVRVGALVETKWNQASVWGNACFNYYTPNGSDPAAFTPGASGNVVCGCVATAMAQIMRYHCYPSEEVTPVKKTCKWNTTSMELTTQGGTYDWEKMTLVPGFNEPEENRQAIGKLTSDAGISVKMTYNEDNSGSSGAYSTDVAPALKETFGYKNAEFYGSNSAKSIYKSSYSAVMFSNFDAGYPVLMSIYGSDAGGHAIVGDGYGYNDDTAYIHLNMGWGGQDDLWYNVPDMETTQYKFTMLIGVAYNIFPDKTGLVLSGRIVDDNGNPMENAHVTVRAAGSEEVVDEMDTTSSGIYGFVLEKGTYDIRAESADGELVNTLAGVSLSAQNSWGNEIELSEPTVRIGETTYTRLDKALRAVTNDDVTVEIILPAKFEESVTLTNRCTIMATSADPWDCRVRRCDGAMLTIADGATVTLSHILFTNEVDTAAGATLVTVEKSSCVKIGDEVDLGVDYEDGVAISTADATGIEVAGLLEQNVLVQCATATQEPQQFGVYSCADDVAAKSAWRILCADDANRETRGQAENGKLTWKVQTVPLDEAAGYFVTFDGSKYVTNAYARIDRVFSQFATLPNALPRLVVRHVLQDIGTLSQPLTVTSRVEIVGEDGAPEIVPTSTAGFTIESSGSLMLSNVVFRGYEAPTSGGCFIAVNGGELILEKGAMLADMIGRTSNKSGVIDVNAGVATMRSGASIIGCKALSYGEGWGQGGAIYVLGTGCQLNLEGGVISNCYASTYGGGVYTYGYGSDAAVRLSGDVVIQGNSSKNFSSADDLYVFSKKALPGFQLIGQLSGRVGVRHSASSGSGNKKGEAFMTNCVGTVTWKTLHSLFNDTDDQLEAATNAVGMLVWVEKDTSETCPEGEASAHVRYVDDTVKHYYDLPTAVKHIEDNSVATIEMYKAGEMTAKFEADLVLSNNCQITLTTRGETAYAFRRNGDVGLTVPSGTSLTLTNIVFTYKKSNNSTKPYISVAGGSLTLASGACVSAGNGGNARNANGITVSAQGTFTMLPGSVVCDCHNAYVPSSSAELQNYGVGGGVLVDNASTAYLYGGAITNCSAVRGGGMQLCNNSTLHISGGVILDGNVNVASNAWDNLFVSDRATVSLDGAMTGLVGMDGKPWVEKDTNFVADVTYVWTNDVVALTNGAAKFKHDVTGDFGVAATNADASALIVWYGAVKETGEYVREEKTYYAILPSAGSNPTPTPEPEEEELLPELTDVDNLSEVLADLSDPNLTANITTLEQYTDFRDWALNTLDAGEQTSLDVSEHVYESYTFGTTNLFENAPVVTITQVAPVDGGLSVSVVVKDGEDAVAVASAKVADMFEGTDDLGDWVTSAIELTVSDMTQSRADEVSFSVKPKEATSTAFIRLKY